MEVYLVTGATSGVGKAFCKKMSKSCVAIARNREKLETLGLKKNFIKVCNLSNLNEIKEVFNSCLRNEFKIKGVIHCAGVCPVQEVSDISENDMVQTYTVNVFSFIELFKLLLQYPMICEDTRVIACSSITADRAYQDQMLYASSKAALNSLVKSMAQAGIKSGIKVNGIEFGAVQTKMFETFAANSETINRHYPLGIIDSLEAAEIINNFLGREYEKMTGSIIRVDSGFFVVHWWE